MTRPELLAATPPTIEHSLFGHAVRETIEENGFVGIRYRLKASWCCCVYGKTWREVYMNVKSAFSNP